MIRSEKLKDKVIESTHQLPHENLLLLDLPGEEWKPFPVEPFGECYMVSNKGRIKRIGHTITRIDSISYYLPDMVLKLTNRFYFNSYLNEKVHHLICKVSVNKRRKGYPVARIIYYAFVEPFDLKDKNFYIRHKDGNGLNCQPDNLYLFERRKLSRWITDRGRRPLRFGVSDRSKFSKEEVQRWNDTTKKTVSQFDMSGYFVQRFDSRVAAAKSIGVNRTNITAAIKGKIPTVGGFLWREGSDNLSRIDVPKIIRPVKVAHYSLTGDLIQVFPSIVEAAQNVDLSTSVVADRIYGRSPHNRFILKIVDENKKPPVKITVELPPTKEFDSQKHGIPEGQYYPFQNLSLEDMPGEEWRVIPDTDNAYWVSNLGRAKAVDRIVEFAKGDNYMKSGQILYQTVKRKKKTNKPMLIVNLIIKKHATGYQIPNLVFKLFNGELPPKHTVYHEDNDPLNCRAENLKMESLSSRIKRYYQDGSISSSNRRKPIAQYSPGGEYITTYSSLQEASEKTGFSAGRIGNCANGKTKYFRKFIWKYIQSEKETKYKIK